MEVFIKIEVKDNNVEQALRVLKRKLQRDGFFKVIKLKNTYEKPSEKKKRILQENIKRVKKLKPLKNQFLGLKNLNLLIRSGGLTVGWLYGGRAAIRTGSTADERQYGGVGGYTAA